MTRIDATFQTCALLGFPAHHSMGPAIHNTAFDELGLPFVYVAHNVAPAELPAAMAGIRALGYRGLSITMPHKVAALDLVDEVDATAKAIGCINTVVNQDGRLLGSNSDGRGAMDALVRAGVSLSGKRVLVLGSGGAARAIAMTVALHGEPAEMEVLGVVQPELGRLGEDLSRYAPVPVRAHLLDDAALFAAIERTEILLQCTPVGMLPETERTLVPSKLLRSDLVAFDAVYNPRRTRLLREAASNGCRVIEGMEMFLGQAMVQFALWTGKPAPMEAMRRVIEARL
jgi:shikimate dehydrogenase